MYLDCHRMEFLFKVMPSPLKSNARFHPSLSCFYALMEGFFLRVSSSVVTPSWWSPSFQNGSSSFGKRRKSDENLVNRELVPIQRGSSRPLTAACSGRCEQKHFCGEAAMICPATTLAYSRTLSKSNATGSLYRLAVWSSAPVSRTHIRKCP